MSNNKNEFMSKVYNLSRSAKEWKTIAFFEGFIIVILLGFIVQQASTVAVRLIPQFNLEKEYLTKVDDTNLEYLRIIAESDLNNYASWTPYTVEKQFKKLTSRLAPGSYGDFRLDLKIKAESRKREQVSQAFIPSGAKSYGENIVVKGTIKRWVGSDSVYDGDMFYTLKYRTLEGIPLIVSVRGYKTLEKAVKAAKQ